MKNILTLIILVVSFQGSLLGQNLKKSKALALSEIDTTTTRLPNGDKLQGLEEKYIVIADNGLLLRENPNLQSKKIGKIYFGAQITIVSKTKFTETIIDNGRNIKGHWVKVKFNNFPIHISTNLNENYGYVFDGYLEKKSDNLHRITHELNRFNEFENLEINHSKSPYYLKGDFFGDGISDIAVLLKDKKGTTKIGIINYNETNCVHILGAENDPFKICDYSWVGIFEKVNKGEVLWSNYDDDKGDFVDFKDVPENEKVKLDYNAIYVHASESCGGGFIYWKNGKFNWLQQE